MALEVTSSTVSGLQKVASPAPSAPEQRTVERAADVSTISTSAQIERKVATSVEQGSVNLGYRNMEGASQTENKQTQDVKRIQSAVKRANSAMRQTRCQFAYHEETNRVSIKVFDDETNEVIREIPSEEALELVQKMWEMAGILVDERR